MKTITRHIIGLLLLFGVIAVFAEEKAELFEKQITISAKVRYLVILPEGFKADKQYPLLVFLHGAGERGDNLELVKKNGPFNKIKELNLPFIIVAPQCALNKWWDTDVLDILLDDLLVKYPVDPERVYLTGLSMGGFGTWFWAMAHPGRFAAIAPVCGGGEPGMVSPKMKDLPIWVFHGAKDKTVLLQKSQEMVDAVNKIGGKVKFTVYPEAGHDSWTETYNNPELYQWLLSCKRQSAK